MSVCLAGSRHHVDGIAQVLKNLTPEHFHITLSHQVATRNSQQGYVAVHRSQLIIVVSTEEQGLTEELVLQIIRNFGIRQGLNQSVGTVDTLIALSPEHVGHVVTIVTDQVECLHQLIVRTTATVLVVTGQTSHIKIGALRVGVRCIQVLINTGKRGNSVFLAGGEAFGRQAADVLYIVNATRSKTKCGNGSS